MGRRRSRGLNFLDPPPRAAFKEARALLASLGALDGDGKVTDEGKAIAGLALPPRLARMLVDAARAGEAALAAELAVVLDRARPRRRRGRSDAAAGGFPPRPLAARRRRAAAGEEFGERAHGPSPLAPLPNGRRGSADVGEWLAAAFPDRIAMARGKRGEFLMANGRAAALEPHDPLAGEAYLAIGEIVGRAAAARVVAAAPLTLAEIEAVAGDAIETREETAFDRASASLRARRRRRLGALTLAEGSLSPPADEASAPRWRAGFSSSGRRACRGPSRSRNGAGGSTFCAAPRASPGPTLPIRRSPPRPTGWRRSCSARRGSTN